MSREIHGQAEIAREEGNFLEALQLLDEAEIAYQASGDYLGYADALTSRFLVYKHLYGQTKERVYIIRAEHTILAAVSVSEECADEPACATPYYSLAQFYDEFKEEYDKAIEFYKKSIHIFETNPPEEHKVHLPGYIYTIQGHLYACEFKNGDMSALARLREVTERLSEHPHQYERDVWMSGGYMKLALLQHKTDQERSQRDLMKAKEIIDANPKLLLRAKQWNELQETLQNL